MAWCGDGDVSLSNGMLQEICILAPNGLLQLENPSVGAACCLFSRAPTSLESGSGKQLVRSPGLHA